MADPSTVRVYHDGDVAWVTIDNPPVNATSNAVRADLARAVFEASKAHVAILCAAGKTFVAGGDMTEFDAPPVEPHLPDVVQMIEDSPVPFIAALHGTVLGGGFEIAMACAWRIAAPGTKFGLPEVNVGLIPGAGGTQRLPRLIGMEAAIEMACRGKIMVAEQLFPLGGIDKIEDDPTEAARRMADSLPDRPQLVSRRVVAPFAEDLIESARTALVKSSRGQASPLENLAALEMSQAPFKEGQPRERERHLKLRDTAESRALRHMFFAERAAARPEMIGEAQPHNIETIAVVGGGLMGAGITTAALTAGLRVHLIERNSDAATDARARVANLIEGAVKRGKTSNSAATEALDRFDVHESYTAADNVDLAIEAVFEDLATKQDVFANLSAVMRTNAILATNTSYLDPREIFTGITNPTRCIGLHFFSPAHIMRLLEVVHLPQTSPDVIASGFAFAKRLKKTPVLAGICDGFIGNRILAAYRRAADYLLADGALPHQIDAAMRKKGLAMGPFEAQDMAGLQIAWANRKRTAATRAVQERYVTIADQLCEMGRLGRRTGSGWYDYAEDGKAIVSDKVNALVEAYSKEKGIARRAFTDDEIVSRLLAVMANEGALIVEDGIAASVGDVDVVKVHGYGFPRWRGGPMCYATEIGWEETARIMQETRADSPGSWQIAGRLKEALGEGQFA